MEIKNQNSDNFYPKSYHRFYGGYFEDLEKMGISKFICLKSRYLIPKTGEILPEGSKLLVKNIILKSRQYYLYLSEIEMYVHASLTRKMNELEIKSELRNISINSILSDQ